MADTCACPRHHSDECYRARHGVGYDEWFDGDRERCDCWCHDEYDTQPEDCDG